MQHSADMNEYMIFTNCMGGLERGLHPTMLMHDARSIRYDLHDLPSNSHSGFMIDYYKILIPGDLSSRFCSHVSVRACQ